MHDPRPDDDANSLPPREIFTVSRLNREARMLLERGLGSVWLEGELSNLSRPSSGHWYFSLKDEAAQVRCAMFRQRNMLVRFPVRDGALVLARGRVSVYEARGEFQVVVEHLEDLRGKPRTRAELCFLLKTASQRRPVLLTLTRARRDGEVLRWLRGWADVVSLD